MSSVLTPRTINQYGALQQQQRIFAVTIARFMAHALNRFYCRRALDIRVNPDTIGCAWTREFDCHMLCVDGEIFESGKKKVPIQKYPNICGRDVRNVHKKVLHSVNSRRFGNNPFISRIFQALGQNQTFDSGLKAETSD